MASIDWKSIYTFNAHWIGIKFYDEKPKLNDVKTLTNIRFCEATDKVSFQPVLLDRKSITCPGAQYAFGWRRQYKNKLVDSCYEKQNMQKDMLKSILLQAPYFKKPPHYIGLNTEDEPDLVMSYMSPENVMDLIKTYHSRTGKSLDVSLCSMMSICGGVAARAYLEEKISISFGCNDSRKYADIRRENVAIGIPRSLFNIFVDEEACSCKK